MGSLARRMPLQTVGFTIGVMAISGVPPIGGYVSLGLIHTGVEHNPVVFVLALVAQTLTIAALGRATYLGFFRRRNRSYRDLEPPRAGMRISLSLLGLGCIGFGALPTLALSHIVGPAVSSLLHPMRYADGVLSTWSTLPRESVTFSYGDLTELAITALEIIAGAAVAAMVVRRGSPRAVSVLRQAHGGSVNDYAAVAAVGIIVCCAVLIL